MHVDSWMATTPTALWRSFCVSFMLHRMFNTYVYDKKGLTSKWPKSILLLKGLIFLSKHGSRTTLEQDLFGGFANEAVQEKNVACLLTARVKINLQFTTGPVPMNTGVNLCSWMETKCMLLRYASIYVLFFLK